MTTYYEKNKERILARQLIRYYQKKEEIRTKQKIYAKTDKAKQLQRQSDIKSKQANFENYMWRHLKNRCKKENKTFDLKVSDIIIPKLCPYLQVPLTRILGQGKKQPYNPSIDRIDSTKEYTKDNIQIISEKANRMKQDASIQELYIFATSILTLYKNITNENFSSKS
jgi:hypothetical protein